MKTYIDAFIAILVAATVMFSCADNSIENKDPSLVVDQITYGSFDVNQVHIVDQSVPSSTDPRNDWLKASLSRAVGGVSNRDIYDPPDAYEPRLAIGSGFLIGPDVVMTVKHNISVNTQNCKGDKWVLYKDYHTGISFGYNEFNLKNSGLWEIDPQRRYHYRTEIRLKQLGMNKLLDFSSMYGDFHHNEFSWSRSDLELVQDLFLDIDETQTTCQNPENPNDSCEAGTGPNGYDLINCPCKCSERMTRRDAVILRAQGKWYSLPYPGVKSYFKLYPGIVFDWIAADQPVRPIDGDNVTSLMYHQPFDDDDMVHPGHQQAYKTKLVGSGVVTKTVSAGCPSDAGAEDCIWTSHDARFGTSGSAIIKMLGLGYEFVGVLSGGTGGGDWGYDNPKSGGATRVQLIEYESALPSSYTETNQQPTLQTPKYILPSTPSKNDGTATPGFEPGEAVEVSCAELYSASRNDAFDPNFAVHGMGIGIIGGPSNSKDGVGVLGPVCQPWSDMPYTEHWMKVGHRAHLRWSDLQNFSNGSLPLSPQLQKTFQIRNGVAEPAPMQFCPPGLAMYGMDIIQEKASGKIVGIDALYCRPLNAANDPIPNGDRIYVGNRDSLSEALDGTDLSQWFGTHDPNNTVNPSDSVEVVTLQCTGSKDVVASIWTDAQQAGALEHLGLGCLEMDHL